MKICAGFVLFALLVATVGCADEEEANAWAAEEEAVGESTAELIPTWYASNSRSIYARASFFRGTPNVKITTRSVLSGACRTTGPVVMQRLPASSTTQTICNRLGLTYGPVSSGGYACRTTSSSTQQAVMYYNFTSATQSQLNYNVFDWDGRRMLDQSGWQPGGAGNGCPR